MALCPFSIKELARRPLIPRLLRRLPLAPPFFRISLFRLIIGVSLSGSTICCGSEELPLPAPFRFVVLTSLVSSMSIGVPPTRFGPSSSSSFSSGTARMPFTGRGASSSFCCFGGRPFLRPLDLGAASSSFPAGIAAEGAGAGGAAAVAPFDFRFDVLLGIGPEICCCCAAGGGEGGSCTGDDARFLALFFGGLPTGFFAGTDIGIASFSGSSNVDAGAIDVVLALFEPRVKRKSPSCSSYTASAALRFGIMSAFMSGSPRGPNKRIMALN